MSSSSYDLLVIGGGPAGEAAAKSAKKQSLSVALVERHKLGGTCHNYGCDPTKTLLHVAHTLYAARHVERYGLRIPKAEADWSAVQAWVKSVLQDMQGGTQEDARAATEREGIDVFIGEAQFISAHEVAVGEQTLRAKQIIIATGTVAAVPEVEGLAETGYITNIEAVSLPTLPKRLAILGSGAIGIEFAQLFSRFGVEVTVLERESHLLSTEDRELADQLCSLLADEGIILKTDVDLRQVKQDLDSKRLTLRCGDQPEESLLVDEILVATGRRPVLDELKLDVVGVKTNKKGVVVDDMLRTSVEHIWAVGDITGGFPFTHVANEEAEHAVQNAFAKEPQPFNNEAIPWVTYTSPELSHVGKTEEELRDAKISFKVVHSAMEENDRAKTNGITAGLVKLLVGDDGQILGGHILSEQAGELIAPVVLAMRAKLSVSQLADAIMPYPTLVSSVRNAAAEG